MKHVVHECVPILQYFDGVYRLPSDVIDVSVTIYYFKCNASLQFCILCFTLNLYMMFQALFISLLIPSHAIISSRDVWPNMHIRIDRFFFKKKLKTVGKKDGSSCGADECESRMSTACEVHHFSLSLFF